MKVNHHIILITRKQSEYLFHYVETYDATTNTFREIGDYLLMLKSIMLKQFPNSRSIVFNLANSYSHGKASLTIRNVIKPGAYESMCQWVN